MMQLIPTIQPTIKQHIAYTKLRDTFTKFVIFGGGAGGGKSWLGAEWLLQNCYMYPGTKWFIGRNELTRLMASSFATFNKVCTFHDIPKEDWKFNGQYHYIEFSNGSRIDLLDLKYQPSDPMFQRFGSTEYTGGWIEEGGEVHILAFDVLKSRVGRWMNKEYNLLPPKILVTCNPEQNWLYRLVYKPFKKGLLSKKYAFIQSLYDDNPHTAKEYGESLDEINDPILRARLKYGLWEYALGDNALTDYDSISDLFTNTIDESNDKFFTGDVARYGSDKCVLGDWKGLELYKILAYQGKGIDQTASTVKEELRTEHIPYSHAIADDDGVGGGVVDLVRGIKGFVGNSSAIKTTDEEKQGLPKQNYANLRSQCGFMLAEKINKHEIAITAPLDETTKELIIEDIQQMLKKKETPVESPLALISKDEIKEKLGRSPDYCDMLMMRMYFVVQKPINFVMPTSVGGVGSMIPGTLA